MLGAVLERYNQASLPSAVVVRVSDTLKMSAVVVRVSDTLKPHAPRRASLGMHASGVWWCYPFKWQPLASKERTMHDTHSVPSRLRISPPPPSPEANCGVMAMTRRGSVRARAPKVPMAMIRYTHWLYIQFIFPSLDRCKGGGGARQSVHNTARPAAKRSWRDRRLFATRSVMGPKEPSTTEGA